MWGSRRRLFGGWQKGRSGRGRDGQAGDQREERGLRDNGGQANTLDTFCCLFSFFSVLSPSLF